MARLGRPTKLNPDLTRELVALIAGGTSITATAATLGLDRSTLQDWRKRAWSRRPEDGPFVELHQQLLDALLEGARRRAGRSWQDAAAQLESAFAERWAPPPALDDLLDPSEAWSP